MRWRYSKPVEDEPVDERADGLHEVVGERVAVGLVGVEELKEDGDREIRHVFSSAPAGQRVSMYERLPVAEMPR